MKFTLLVLIICFLPLAISAQYLEFNDIDVFIEGKELIFETIGEHIDIFGRNIDTDETWINYNYMQKAYSQSLIFENINSSDEIYYEEKYKQIEEAFLGFINCIVPNELKEAFELIGWDNNGNQKFWTIFYVFIRLKEGMGVDLLFDQIKTLEEMIEEIEEIEDVKNELRNKLKKIILFTEFTLKTLEIVNISDIELISSRYNELSIVLP